MKKSIVAAFFALVFAGSAGAAFGAGFTLTLKAGYFMPSDQVFRDVYGGGPAFGGEVAIPLAGPVQLWAGADVFGKTGLLSVSEEETKVRITPLYAGLRAEFGRTGLRPYVGARGRLFPFP